VNSTCGAIVPAGTVHARSALGPTPSSGPPRYAHQLWIGGPCQMYDSNGGSHPTGAHDPFSVRRWGTRHLLFGPHWPVYSAMVGSPRCACDTPHVRKKSVNRCPNVCINEKRRLQPSKGKDVTCRSAVDCLHSRCELFRFLPCSATCKLLV
jgi:hypothetical protein